MNHFTDTLKGAGVAHLHPQALLLGEGHLGAHRDPHRVERVRLARPSLAPHWCQHNLQGALLRGRGQGRAAGGRGGGARTVGRTCTSS